jgi:hypothetical protein
LKFDTFVVGFNSLHDLVRRIDQSFAQPYLSLSMDSNGSTRFSNGYHIADRASEEGYFGAV